MKSSGGDHHIDDDDNTVLVLVLLFPRFTINTRQRKTFFKELIGVKAQTFIKLALRHAC